MNRPLRRVAIACLLLFLILLVNVNIRQAVKGDDYRNDPGNRRVLERTYDRQRGSIALDGPSRPLIARSIERKDQQFTYLRTYPAKGLYAHVTGFYSFLIGATGLEQTQDDTLTGESDALFTKRLSDTLTGRQPRGGDVVLTLRAAAQQAAATALAGKRGAVVALDPKTGAVLAMVSSPTYDPNLLSSFNGTAVKAAYSRLVADSDRPLRNRATQETYPPGSTFKIITSAAALADGLTPDTLIDSPTTLDLPLTGSDLRNFGGETCGANKITLAQALKISCNTAFGKLGMDLGEAKLQAQARAFGFSDDSLDDELMLPGGATSSIGTGLDAPQLAFSGIGQFDDRATPLQMALVAAGVANNGAVMKPYLIDRVQAPDLSTIKQAKPELYNQAVSPAVAAELTTMMEGVVSGGTGTAAQISGVTVAGKTGTAENGSRPEHAWFIGFAPAQDPQVAVAVFVENGGLAVTDTTRDPGATGGRVAAPIAAAVMRAVLGLG